MSARNTLQDPNTHKALANLPALYATEDTKGDRQAVKLFDSLGSAYWVIWEYDADQKLGFGWADLGLGFPEMGYISVEELETLGIRIERDIHTNTMVKAMNSRSQEVPGYIL